MSEKEVKQEKIKQGRTVREFINSLGLVKNLRKAAASELGNYDFTPAIIIDLQRKNVLSDNATGDTVLTSEEEDFIKNSFLNSIEKTIEADVNKNVKGIVLSNGKIEEPVKEEQRTEIIDQKTEPEKKDKQSTIPLAIEDFGSGEFQQAFERELYSYDKPIIITEEEMKNVPSIIAPGVFNRETGHFNEDAFEPTGKNDGQNQNIETGKKQEAPSEERPKTGGNTQNEYQSPIKPGTTLDDVLELISNESVNAGRKLNVILDIDTINDQEVQDIQFLYHFSQLPPKEQEKIMKGDHRKYELVRELLNPANSEKSSRKVALFAIKDMLTQTVDICSELENSKPGSKDRAQLAARLAAYSLRGRQLAEKIPELKPYFDQYIRYANRVYIEERGTKLSFFKKTRNGNLVNEDAIEQACKDTNAFGKLKVQGINKDEKNGWLHAQIREEMLETARKQSRKKPKEISERKSQKLLKSNSIIDYEKLEQYFNIQTNIEELKRRLHAPLDHSSDKYYKIVEDYVYATKKFPEGIIMDREAMKNPGIRALVEEASGINLKGQETKMEEISDRILQKRVKAAYRDYAIDKLTMHGSKGMNDRGISNCLMFLAPFINDTNKFNTNYDNSLITNAIRGINPGLINKKTGLIDKKKFLEFYKSLRDPDDARKVESFNDLIKYAEMEMNVSIANSKENANKNQLKIEAEKAREESEKRVVPINDSAVSDHTLDSFFGGKIEEITVANSKEEVYEEAIKEGDTTVLMTSSVATPKDTSRVTDEFIDDFNIFTGANNKGEIALRKSMIGMTAEKPSRNFKMENNIPETIAEARKAKETLMRDSGEAESEGKKGYWDSLKQKVDVKKAVEQTEESKKEKGKTQGKKNVDERSE